MEPDKAYPAVVDKPTFTLLLDRGEPAGWVDYRTVALKIEGSDCLTRRDERQITEFPSICSFSPLLETVSYSSSDLSEPGLHTLFPDQNYVLLLQYQESYFSAYGHAGPSFYVSREDVEISGDCQDIPSGGTTTTTAGLYGLPDPSEDNLIITLLENQPVYIQNQTRSGDPPQDGTSDGFWIQVRTPSTLGGYDGWIWSEFLEFN
jgi:hypothetical protein